MELNKQTMKRICQIILFAALVFLGLINISAILSFLGKVAALLSPFIIGCCVAFIINVPMRFFERLFFKNAKRKFALTIKRPLCIFITLVLFIGVIFIVLYIMIPELYDTITSIINNMDTFTASTEKWMKDVIDNVPFIKNSFPDFEPKLDAIATTITDYLKTIDFTTAGSVIGSTFGVLGSIVSGVANAVIGIVFALYILITKEHLGLQAKQLLYSIFSVRRCDQILSILRLSDRTFSNFLSGQCLEAVILGSMFYISMTILGFPYALLVGVVVAFTALIPIFGAFIGCFVGGLLILVINPMQALWFVVLFIILQQIEGNFIYPFVVGNSVGLPSLWVLFAVTIGGNLMGVVGMIIMIPIVSVVYTLLEANTLRRLARRKVPREKWLIPKPATPPKRSTIKMTRRDRKRYQKETEMEFYKELIQTASSVKAYNDDEVDQVIEVLNTDEQKSFAEKDVKDILGEDVEEVLEEVEAAHVHQKVPTKAPKNGTPKYRHKKK